MVINNASQASAFVKEFYIFAEPALWKTPLLCAPSVPLR